MKRTNVAGYDILGNIAMIKFPRGMKLGAKKKFAEKFLKTHVHVTTVLEKSAKIHGRLRTPTTKFVSGVKTKEAIYKENGCVFRLNVDSCYFSPRLAAERNEVAGLVKKDENVLVMFGGVAPFAIVIAKHSRAKKVVSIELGKIPSQYALENVKRNKLTNVEIIQGNVRRILPTMKEKFSRVVMARPNLKDNFLDVAFSIVKKNGMIHYYGFYLESEKEKMIEMISDEAKKSKKNIKILKVKKAGDIGVKKFRFRVDVKVVN